jgi:hypothetical protein
MFASLPLGVTTPSRTETETTNFDPVILEISYDALKKMFVGTFKQSGKVLLTKYYGVPAGGSTV